MNTILSYTILSYTNNNNTILYYTNILSYTNTVALSISVKLSISVNKCEYTILIILSYTNTILICLEYYPIITCYEY